MTKTRKIKHSFRLKITLFITVSIALALLFCWFINSAFLERFYVNRQKKQLINTFSNLNRELGTESMESLSDELKTDIDRRQLSSDVEIYIFADKLRDVVTGTEYATYFIYPRSVVISKYNRNEPKYRDLSHILDAYQGYLFLRSEVISKVEILVESSEYTISTQHDNAMDSDFMDLYGILDCGYLCFVRIGLQSIGVATEISNKFLAIIGIIIIAFATVVALYFSKRFTRPVLELSGIAKRMAELDFSAKYKGKTKDEVGQLGDSMNRLSETLEGTISELKSANIMLQTDIARKTEIEKMRTDFISNVTHELKTPISIVQGYAEGLKDCINDDPESREFYCDVIIDEAGKMNRMVQKLLSLMKIESGGTPLNIEHFSLSELVAGLIQKTDILLKQKNINLAFEPADKGMVWADEYLTEEVVTNYLSNAINYASENGSIVISLNRIENRIRLAVFNTGEHIPEEDLDKVWTKFFKVDKARTREYGGTGIGLSIVRAIMDAHGMPYGVQNVPDGVEFFADFDASEK